MARCSAFAVTFRTYRSAEKLVNPAWEKRYPLAWPSAGMISGIRAKPRSRCRTVEPVRMAMAATGQSTVHLISASAMPIAWCA